MSVPSDGRPLHPVPWPLPPGSATLQAKTAPLHQQILEELRRQIRDGELKPGDSLPSEGDLMARFSVARGTIRSALATLRADGTISGPRGHPPVVCEGRLAQPFTNLVSFSAWIRSLGRQPSGKLIELALRPASDETAEMLALRPGSLVYHLVRVRYADGEPLMIERATLPPAIGSLVAQMDVEHCSICSELESQGIIFASGQHEIDALAASTADARLLQTTPRTPLLRVRRRSFTPAGEPIEWSDDRYLATRVAFTLDNSAAHAGIARRLDLTVGRQR